MRTVECISHDSAGPRVVEDAVCGASAEAPPSLQTCNMHKCPEYRVAGWSAVSYKFHLMSFTGRYRVLLHVHEMHLHRIETWS